LKRIQAGSPDGERNRDIAPVGWQVSFVAVLKLVSLANLKSMIESRTPVNVRPLCGYAMV